MRLSNLVAAMTMLATTASFAQPCPGAPNTIPVPTDIPYSISVHGAVIMGEDNVLWSASDGGVYINAQGQQVISDSFKSLQTANTQLSTSIVKANQEIAQANASAQTYTYVSVAASVVGTIVTAIAVGLATKK